MAGLQGNLYMFLLCINVHSDIIHVLLGQETCQFFSEVNVPSLRAILKQLECI